MVRGLQCIEQFAALVGREWWHCTVLHVPVEPVIPTPGVTHAHLN